MMISNTRLFTRRALLGLFAAAGFGATNGVRAETWPAMKVAKDPNCGCCSGWVKHMQRNGFKVTVTETTGMRAIKTRLGVPANLASCHTAEIAGYVIEGHVPARAVARLLAEKPAAIGLAVPGMPIGSPGMEGGTPQTFDVVLFDKDGQRSFSRYKGDREV